MAESGINIDACIIGTPDKYHHDMAIKAMRYGWHVLLEKPMGLTTEECDEIVRVSKETGKMLSLSVQSTVQGFLQSLHVILLTDVFSAQ